MSRCELIRPELVAADRGELADAGLAAVRAHVAGCAACAAEQRRLRRVVELVAAATDVEPRAEASARLRSAVDAALAGRGARLHDLQARRGLAGAWDGLRRRYEDSAAVRRFTLASIGVHAAAALLLAVLVARSGGAPERAVSLHVGTREPEVVLPGGGGATASALPAFDAYSPDGVASPDAPGVLFPNRTTAQRWGRAASRDGRRLALAAAFGVDAPRAEIAVARGLEWLDRQRADDGSYGEGADRVETTAAAVLAHAGDGRTTADEPALADSVAWLARSAETAEAQERALALRALTAQYVMDFAKLPRPERVRRAQAVEAFAARVEGDAPRDGAEAVAAVAALADVRAAGLRDTGPALSRLVRELDWSRTAAGFVRGASVEDGVGLTATLVEVAADAGAEPLSETSLRTLEGRIAQNAASSPRDAARGAAALAAVGRPVRGAVLPALAAQRADGRWTSLGAAPGARSDTYATAMGVVAVTRAFRR